MEYNTEQIKSEITAAIDYISSCKTWKETRELEHDLNYWIKLLIDKQNTIILNGVNDDDKQYR